MDSKKIVMFGGGGFIGSHLVEILLKQDYCVKAIDIDSKKISEKCFKDKNFEFRNLDINNDGEELSELIEHSDIVIDLISYAMPALYIEKPLDVVDLNFFQNLKIVKKCIKYNKRLVQFSTCEVYGMLGDRSGVFNEESSALILGPVNKQRWIYSCAKQLLERVIYAYGNESLLNYTIIRPFNFIGPEMDFLVRSRDEGTPRVFANFMSSLVYDNEMYVVDGGTNMRTFTYIKDAVEAIGLIVKNENYVFNNQIVNIGNPENETTIYDLAVLMREIYKEETGIEEVPKITQITGKDFYGEGYQDSEKRIPDIKKLMEIGWYPKYGLRETLELSMKYYVKNINSTIKY